MCPHCIAEWLQMVVQGIPFIGPSLVLGGLVVARFVKDRLSRKRV